MNQLNSNGQSQTGGVAVPTGCSRASPAADVRVRNALTQLGTRLFDGVREDCVPPVRRLRTLQPSRARVQLVPDVRGDVEPAQRRVLHSDPGVVPLQTGPAAAAISLPAQQPVHTGVPEPHRPLGARKRPEPL